VIDNLSEEATSSDLEIITQQLKRTPRGILSIKARCNCKNPAVISCNPIIDDKPFPTFYWLTLPWLHQKISKLEASGLMEKFNQRLENDPDFKALIQKTHQEYIQTRNSVQDISEQNQMSAGGMPNHIKCLHSLVAHSLAEGPNHNPIGDEVLEILSQDYDLNLCHCD